MKDALVTTMLMQVWSLFINMLALWFVGAAIEMSHVGGCSISTISAVGERFECYLSSQYITVGAEVSLVSLGCLADIVMN
jgi:hypothetical protein